MKLEGQPIRPRSLPPAAQMARLITAFTARLLVGGSFSNLPSLWGAGNGRAKRAGGARGGPVPPSTEERCAVFSKIVVGTDGSGTANAAVALAVELARRFEAELHMVNAYHGASASVAAAQAGMVGVGAVDMSAALLQEASEEMLAAAAETAKDVTIHTHAVQGAPAEAVLQVAEGVGADVIVVGSKGMKRRVLGSVPNSVAHGAPCHVLIAKTA